MVTRYLCLSVFAYTYIAYVYFFSSIKKTLSFHFYYSCLVLWQGKNFGSSHGKFRMMFLKWMQLYFTCFPFSFWETYVQSFLNLLKHCGCCLYCMLQNQHTALYSWTGIPFILVLSFLFVLLYLYIIIFILVIFH